jgi:hypothetical protein
MKNKLLSFLTVCIFAITSNLQAITVEVTCPSGGGLKDEIAKIQTNLAQVTDLTVRGTIDARDFRFIRDSLNASLTSLDLSEVAIAAYSGSYGTEYTDSDFMGVGGGDNKDAKYEANVVPKTAFYWKKGTGLNLPIERKMTKLTSLKLPESAVEIGGWALSGTESLSTLDLSKTALTKIGSSAFSKSGISSVVFPETVTALGYGLFYSCTKLTSVTIPKSVKDIAKEGGSGFFDGCLNLETVTFDEPSQITTLPLRFLYSDAGENMMLSKLMEFTVPSSVTNVSTAFENFIGTKIDCHPNNKVYYSQNGCLYKRSDNSLEAIPKGITSFIVPASMTVIPDRLFEYCTKLTSLTIESQLTEIGERAFFGSSITQFDFPKSLVKIGEMAFCNTKLTRVSFRDNSSLTTIGREAFSNIETLEEVDLSGLNAMGVGMFQSCTKLTKVTFAPDLTAIAISAFSGCATLETIQIPNTVKKIEGNAFNSCIKLTNVNLPSSLESIGTAAFQNDTLIARFHIPVGLVNLPCDDFSGHAFTSTCAEITVDDNNPKFTAESGLLLSKDKKILLHIPASRTVKQIVVPDGVDSIANNAFYSNSFRNRNIKKLTLPASLRIIANFGLSASVSLDTLVVKAIIPPVCVRVNSLGNDWASSSPLIFIPPKSKENYIVAEGWKYWYNNDNGNKKDNYIMMSIFHDLGWGYSNAVSPNGKWIVSDNENSESHLFDNETGTFTVIPEAAEARDVNDRGDIVGMFVDTKYPLGGGQYLVNGGVYRDGKWYSLGLGRFGTTTTSSEAYASPYAIDAKGNVYGMCPQLGSFSQVVPFAWKYNTALDNYTTDTLAYAMPCTGTDQGGRINAVSSDGSIAAGWVARSVWGGVWLPTYWLSPTEYAVVPNDNFSEAKGVSSNGKYIATTVNNRAAVYDVEKDTTIVFGVEGSTAKAVSDNGFVVGYAGRGISLEAGRQGFVWSEKLGLTWLRDFIDKYCPGIEIPDDDMFKFPKDAAVMDVPMGISADGLVITGWSGYTNIARKGWVINLPDQLDLIDRPHNLTATVDIPARTRVMLKWDAPTDFKSHTLDFYNIYRNGELLKELWDANDNGTTYIDEDAPEGYNIYTVSAIFDFNSATDYVESGLTNEAYATIVDNYDLPFFDSFEYYDPKTNFWEVEYNTTCVWLTIFGAGFDAVNATMLFSGSGNGEPYQLSLTSKPLNANGKNKVMLSYLFRVLTENERLVGKKDTVVVEIGVNGVWTPLKSHVIDNRYVWTPTTLDISNLAAGKLFQIRFRAISGENRNGYNFLLDNFAVALENATAPTGVKAVKYTDENKVRLYYKNNKGTYGFSYHNGKPVRLVGNEGKPFIVVEKIEPKDLKPLEGKYLTSVSAFLYADNDGTSVPTQLRLAVFANGTRVDNTDISSYNGNSWNNFKLKQPLQITGNDTLLVGLEVVALEHPNAPIAMDSASTANFINSKLLSYDDGTTWRSAAEESGVINEETGETRPFDGAWVIAANFRDENTASGEDDDFQNIAYNVYRNGEIISKLYCGQVFADTAFNLSDSYQVAAFSLLGGLSELSESAAIDVFTLLTNPQIVQFYVYPNPAQAYVNITIDFEELTVYDGQGRLITKTKDRKIDVRSFAKGLYIIEATLKTGNHAVARMIVE